MSYYTKTGDDGTTAQSGGIRVPKNSPFIEAYGEVDEACAFVGLAAADSTNSSIKECLDILLQKLMACNTVLATEAEKRAESTHIHREDIAWIESEIDSMSELVGPLAGFVIFNNCEAAANINVARTVARRAERAFVSLLNSDETLGRDAYLRNVAIFLNRASDLLFACACAKQIERKGSLSYA